MPFWHRKKKGKKTTTEQERATPDPSWVALSQASGGGLTTYGNPRGALQIPALGGGIQIIVNSLASLPPAIYRTEKGEKRRIEDHQLSVTLRNPARDLSWFTFMQLLATDYLLHGNAVATWDSEQGRETLTPIPWSSVSLESDTKGNLSYSISPPAYAGSQTTQGTKRYTEDRVWHIKDGIGSTDGGYTGRGAIQRGSDAAQLSASLINHLISFFEKHVNSCGFVSTKGKLSPSQREQLRDEFKRFTGSKSAGNFMLFDSELSYSNLTARNDESQVAELRKAQNQECANVLAIPHFFVDPSHTTFASAVESRRALVSQVLQPLARSFSTTFDNRFLPRGETLLLDTSYLTRETPSLLELFKEGVITERDLRRHLGIESEKDTGGDNT